MTTHMHHPVLPAFCYMSNWDSASPVLTRQCASIGDLCLMTETKYCLHMLFDVQDVNFPARMWARLVALLQRLVAFVRSLAGVGRQQADMHDSTQYGST
jgi:hypothetical protein